MEDQMHFQWPRDARVELDIKPYSSLNYHFSS